jgi:adenylate cyclase
VESGGPLGALTFAPSEARWWTAGFLLIMGVALVSDPNLQPEAVPDPGTARIFFTLNLGGVGLATYFVLRDFLVRLQDARAELQREQERSERLLLNMLPEQIARRLKDGEEVIADRLDDVTVVFSDLVGFTPMSQQLPASEVVSVLAELVADFDRLARKHGLEKIRTQGDAYMAVAGAPHPRPDHVEAAARMALDMIETAHRHLDPFGSSMELRVGIDCGPVVAGVIGLDKFVYDVWGDPVNTASRMESHGVPGRIHVTPNVHERLQHEFEFEARGTIDVKGKGPMSTYFLAGVHLAIHRGHDRPEVPTQFDE